MSKTNRKRPVPMTHSIRRVSGAYQVVTKAGACVASIVACASYADAVAALSIVNR